VLVPRVCNPEGPTRSDDGLTCETNDEKKKFKNCFFFPKLSKTFRKESGKYIFDTGSGVNAKITFRRF
jgi:hypothetical protein